MKLPKNKANLYLIIRRHHNDITIVGGFSNLLPAEDFCDACRQEWKDLAGDDSNVSFYVDLTTYYAS